MSPDLILILYSGFANFVHRGDWAALKTLPSGFALGARHILIKIGISNACNT